MKYLLTGQETNRLIFRLLERTDFNSWLELFKDKTVAGFFGMDKTKTPEEHCEEWFQRIENRYKNNLGGMNVLINKTSGEFIGQCGLLIQEVDDIEELEIGYSILPKFRNKGYATEAAKKCRDYAFENNVTDSLISIIHVDNIRSEKVAKNNGMSLTKQTIFRDMPVNIFRINKSEWSNI
ncbi:MAG: GNAT family N-acetyltransferase [Bacteroidales bacterium]|nr:GNAT family N-acetyltransferase [Bacteroidales bacterium]